MTGTIMKARPALTETPRQHSDLRRGQKRVSDFRGLWLLGAQDGLFPNKTLQGILLMAMSTTQPSHEPPSQPWKPHLQGPRAGEASLCSPGKLQWRFRLTKLLPSSNMWLCREVAGAKVYQKAVQGILEFPKIPPGGPHPKVKTISKTTLIRNLPFLLSFSPNCSILQRLQAVW